MLWFFEKERDRLRYEIRREPNGPRIQLVITHPDGHEEVEAFDHPEEVVARTERLRHDLHGKGWQPPVTRARPRASALDS